jgi:hypothetical protein
MAKLPQWSTPERRKHLVKLAVRARQSNGFCAFGHQDCTVPEHSYYDRLLVEHTDTSYTLIGLHNGDSVPMMVKRDYVRSEIVLDDKGNLVEGPYLKGLIDFWKAEDRERRSYEWELEQRQLNDGTYGKYGSRFDPVARDAFFANRPEYYLVAMGVNPLTHRRVALVRVPSTFVHLFVDCGGGTVREVSKHAKRKAKRYGKAGAYYQTVHDRCTRAIRHYWNSR